METENCRMVFWKNRFHLRQNNDKNIIEGIVNIHKLYICNFEFSEFSELLFKKDYEFTDKLDPGCCIDCIRARNYFICFIYRPYSQVYVFCEHNLGFTNRILIKHT